MLELKAPAFTARSFASRTSCLTLGGNELIGIASPDEEVAVKEKLEASRQTFSI